MHCKLALRTVWWETSITHLQLVACQRQVWVLTLVPSYFFLCHTVFAQHFYVYVCRYMHVHKFPTVRFLENPRLRWFGGRPYTGSRTGRIAMHARTATATAGGCTIWIQLQIPLSGNNSLTHVTHTQTVMLHVTVSASMTYVRVGVCTEIDTKRPASPQKVNASPGTHFIAMPKATKSLSCVRQCYWLEG